MFTGIITAVGRISAAIPSPHGLELTIECSYSGLEPGESIAVDGACLTVQRVEPAGFNVQIVRTSLERTRFGSYAPGQQVNLERALRVGDRLGGHLVQGHVDGVGRVERVVEREDAWLMDLSVPP